LVAAPSQAVPLLKKKMPLPTREELRRIQALLADLPSEDFQTRTRAEAELVRLNGLAEMALRERLRTPPRELEGRRRVEAILRQALTATPGRWLAILRGLDALERMATPEARELLRELSEGLAESPQTREARRGLARLDRRLAAQAR